MTFEPARYGALVADVLSEPRLMPLDAGGVDEKGRRILADLTAADLFADFEIADADMARGCLAGLWLYVGDLDRSHGLSQGIETREGSYWHGIMHRREGDFSNAKYWFRRVSKHEIHAPLGNEAQRLTRESGEPHQTWMPNATVWDSFEFVDLCAAAIRESGALAAFCRRLQAREWELLFDYCFNAAVTKG